ncbi:MAG: 1-acyl-sn-glycerol-3-phosphate acyltransferase [Butyrivibrio sp.]|nr:1-acyl-sn-glycerol-3-phosphate acyltransferase [Butyrivibrio sp.]
MASDFVNNYRKLTGFLLNLNGIVYVDERDRQDKANTKNLMIKLLQSGRNVMIFPEGTWNFSENEIITDIAYGAAEAAICADAVILPIALEQYGRRFVVCKGNVIEPSKLSADKCTLTTILRDTLATLKWKIWEKEGVSRQSELPPDYWEDLQTGKAPLWYRLIFRDSYK